MIMNKNSMLIWALYVVLAILIAFVFLKILPFLLFLVAVVAVSYLIYALVEVNAGRKTVPEVKQFAKDKIKSGLTHLKDLFNS